MPLHHAILTSSLLMLMVYASPSPLHVRVALHAQPPPPSNTTQDTREQGIELYRKGEIEAAIKALSEAVKQNKNDLSAWHYLGLALNGQNKQKEARKAHEQAALLGYQLLMDHTSSHKLAETFVFPPAMKTQIDEAADSAEKYLEAGKISGSKAAEWRARAELLRDSSELAGSEKAGHEIFSNKEVTTKARILARPEPQYTEEARSHGTTGTVALRVVLTADGKVRAILPVKTLPHGLTEKSINAARQIRFDPATKDGKPVSQLLQIEYNFDLY